MPDNPKTPKLRTTRLDFATIGGLAVAFGGILYGLVKEGGKISDVTVQLARQGRAARLRLRLRTPLFL